MEEYKTLRQVLQRADEIELIFSKILDRFAKLHEKEKTNNETRIKIAEYEKRLLQIFKNQKLKLEENFEDISIMINKNNMQINDQLADNVINIKKATLSVQKALVKSTTNIYTKIGIFLIGFLLASCLNYFNIYTFIYDNSLSNYKTQTSDIIVEQHVSQPEYSLEDTIDN